MKRYGFDCMKNFLALTILLIANLCRAAPPSTSSDSFGSELSHAVGGALMAGGISYLYRDSPDRAMMGFGLSTAAIVIVESINISRGADRSSQYLDMAAHALGSAIGAWYTDKYLLMPVVTKASVGLVYQKRF